MSVTSKPGTVPWTEKDLNLSDFASEGRKENKIQKASPNLYYFYNTGRYFRNGSRNVFLSKCLQRNTGSGTR